MGLKSVIVQRPVPGWPFLVCDREVVAERDVGREPGVGEVVALERDDQIRNRKNRGSKGGRPPTLDTEAYKGRNVVERSFNTVKQWRGLATRFDKHAINYRAAVVLSAVITWLKTLIGDTP